jgi:hypothetical protein
MPHPDLFDHFRAVKIYCNIDSGGTHTRLALVDETAAFWVL